MDIQQFEQESIKRKKSNTDFIKKLKRKTPKDLDHTVHGLHDEVFDEIDCLNCANCCKTTSPIFTDKDIERLARRFRVRPSIFIEQYLYLDNEGHYVLHSSPCPFLGEDSYCSVYEDRPRACREYPHTNRKKFAQLLNLTLKNTEICPATLEILERLKRVY